ncbi:MAG TPA: histidine kinase dimerization/phospho-acceptor domain-containing protein, partial [Oligoflexia bacterium]|nr:histidine kinase dimerization/phospho-acceptor domain-containing protein [Oligoflexia bacterium]
MNCDKLTQPRLALRRSLFWKISRLVFFATAFGLVLHFFGAVFFQQIFTDKVMQITSWEVAEHCKRELQPFLEPAVDQTGLARAVNRLEELNPLMEIFVLDRSGNVLYNGRRDRAVRIPVEPIAQFLAQQGFPARPIYGANGGGYDIDGPVPFSAAQISVAGEPGYLYTSLRSQRYRTTYHALGDFALPLAGLIFLAALLLLTTGLGSILAYWFTRRFRALTAAAGRLAAGDYRTRVSDAVDDEIGLHARVFNQMAETIEQSIATISESEELRRQLVANVSHDLRTPIAATMALLETIDTRFSELNEEELQQLIQRARLNCLWLKVLVDELFELSELDAQKEKLV